LRSKNSGAEHLQENAQAIVVKPRRRANDRGGGSPVTRYQYLCERIGEVWRQMIHRGHCPITPQEEL
jgi:hypothetical protein